MANYKNVQEMLVANRKGVDAPFYNNLSFSGTDAVASVNLKYPVGNEYKLFNAKLGSLSTLSYSIHMDRHPIRSVGKINVKDYVMGPRTIAGSMVFTVFNKHFALDLINQIEEDVKQDITLLADEFPPFDVIVSFANEYGAQARLVLYGVRFVNEGQVISINDLITENTFQYYATDIEYMNNKGKCSSGIFQYPKYTIGKVSKNKLRDKQASGSNKDLQKEVANSNNNGSNKETNIVLKVNTKDPIKSRAKGLAQFEIIPKQTSGLLEIVNNDMAQTLNISIKEDSSKIIPVDLSPGQYSARYYGETYSNHVEFIIGKYIEISSPISNPPLILNRSENSITVMSNNLYHSSVNYAKIEDSADIEFKSVNFNNGKAVINGLQQNELYRIFSDGDTPSAHIDTKTLKSNYVYYNGLLNDVTCNENKILHGATLDDYESIINEAYRISDKFAYQLSVQDALYKVFNKYNTEFKSLKRENFPTENEFLKATKAVAKSRDIASDLLLINQDNTNEESSIINNKRTLSKTPSQAIIYDYANLILVISNEIKRIEIYEYESDKMIYSAMTSSLKQRSEGYELKFIGTPSKKYYCFGIDSKNNKSPKLDFYFLPEVQKIKELNKIKEDTTYYNNIIKANEVEIKNELLNNNVTEEEYLTSLIQYSKVPRKALLDSPRLVSFTNDKIILDVSNKEFIGSNSAFFYVAIAEEKNALKNKMFKKKTFYKDTTTITFTDEEDFIDKDKKYIAWIEDSSFNQISLPVVISRQTDENRIQFFNAKMKEDLIKMLKQYRDVTPEIKEFIYEVNFDSEYSLNGYYKYLATCLLNNKPVIENQDDYAYIILNNMIVSKSITDKTFFNKPILYNRNEDTLTFDRRRETYFVVLMKINKDDTIEVSHSSVERDTIFTAKLDGTSNYFVYCIAKDFEVKSNTMLINSLDKSYKSYMRVEVL